jgi:cytoskeletal protein CcmA (bactofilin family)
MAWDWLEKKIADPDEWTGFLERGIRVVGDIESSGTLRVNSRVQGSLKSQSMLILGDEAEVEGQLEARVVIVGGKFKGIVRALERVEIREKGVVNGEVHARCLLIEPGAIFEGTCHMMPEASNGKIVAIPIRAAGRG